MLISNREAILGVTKEFGKICSQSVTACHHVSSHNRNTVKYFLTRTFIFRNILPIACPSVFRIKNQCSNAFCRNFTGKKLNFNMIRADAVHIILIIPICGNADSAFFIIRCGSFLDRLNLYSRFLYRSRVHFSRGFFRRSRILCRSFHGGRFLSRCFHRSSFFCRRFYRSRFFGRCFHRSSFFSRRFYRSRFFGRCFRRSRFFGRCFHGGSFLSRCFYRSRFFGRCFHGGSFLSRSFYRSSFFGRCFHRSSFFGRCFHGGSFLCRCFHRSRCFYRSRYFSRNL